MENRIYKYELEIIDEQVIELPKDAQILTVQAQKGELVLWANVFPKNKTSPRVIEIYGTGHPFPSAGMGERKYISTVQMGSLVWHIFEAI